MQKTKYSRQRELLISIIRNTKCHPDADWIYARAREQMPNISLGTVYRNLSRLVQDGDVVRLDIGTGSDHFDGDLSAHSHLVCKDCGTIIDVFHDYSTAICKDASEKLGAEITRCDIVFKGKCKNCSEQNPA